MTVNVIGTCSQCGGPVEVPHAYYSIYLPTPTCRNCGARAASNHGPIIKTVKPSGSVGWEGKIKNLEQFKQ